MDTPADPIAAAKAQRRAHADAVLTALGRAPGVRMSAGDLHARTGVASRTLTDVIRDLIGLGHVARDGAKGGLWLTPAGRVELDSRTGAATPSGLDVADPRGALTAVLEVLPCEEYRAFVRLTVAAALAKRHLLATVSTGWPALVAAGPTGTGKTNLLYGAVCRVLGLDFDQHRHMLRNRTRSDILFQKVQGSGGQWSTVGAPSLAAPLALYDEVHQADGEALAALWDLLEGASKVEGVAGQHVLVQPAVLAFGNTDRDEPLIGSYRTRTGFLPPNIARRCVVLDGWPLARFLQQSAPAAITALKAARVRPLDLAAHRPAADELPAQMAGFLNGLKTASVPNSPLTAAGAELFSPESIGLLVLGLSALWPADLPADHRLAMALHVVLLDYLTVTSTTPAQVVANWSDVVAPLRDALSGAHPALAPALATPQSALPEATDEAEQNALREQLDQRRAVVVGRIDDCAKRLPRTPADWWSQQQRDELRTVRATLAAKRRALERVDGAGGIRARSGIAALRAALERLEVAARDAGTAIDHANSWRFNMDQMHPPGPLPAAGRRRATNAPGVPAAARRSRKPRKGQPPVAGLNWIPKTPA